jgi:hypothetical protein
LELPQSFFVWCGNFGVLGYVGSYAALQLGFIRGSSMTYTFCNLVSAALVLVSLFDAFNLPSALIQITWIIISIVGLTRYFILSRRLRFSDEEINLIDRIFPIMPKLLARSFLDSGNWIDAPKGYVLTVEGEPVGALYYVSNGKVGVAVSGKTIGSVENGLLGEMNVLSGAAASASAGTVMPTRLFMISRDLLQKLCRSDGDFRIALENGLSGDTSNKLVAANKLLSY